MPIYVYFMVGGGPVAIQQGGDWIAILNEAPQTILISLSSTIMLATTVVSCVAIVSAQHALTKELTLDIGWLSLWGTASYFALILQSSRE